MKLSELKTYKVINPTETASSFVPPPETTQPTSNRVAGALGFGKTVDTIGSVIARGRATEAEKEFIPDPTLKEKVGAGLQLGSLLFPGATVAKGVAGVASKVLPAAGARAVGAIGSGALGGAAFDIGSDLEEGRELRPGLGTAIGAAVPAGALAVGAVRRALPKILSYTSDVPEKAFDQLLQRRGTVVEAIKAGTTAEDALKNTQQAVRGLRTTLSKEWQEGVNEVAEQFTGKTLAVPDFVDKTPLINNLEKLSDEFGINLPENLQSISVSEGIDVLKQINELPKAMLTLSPKGAIVRQTKDEFKKLLVSQFGGSGGIVDNLYRNYAAKKGVFDAANQIVQAYQQGKPIQQSTALGRLKALFNENKSAYLDAIIDLEKQTGKDLLSKITAVQFGAKFPKGLASVSSSGGLQAPKGVVDKALDLMILPLSSPRMAGFLARKLGKTGVTPFRTPGDILLNKASQIKPVGGLSIEVVSGGNPPLQEARKYKSAEEFVKGQGEPLYHGTSAKEFDKFSGINYFTKDAKEAEGFARGVHLGGATGGKTRVIETRYPMKKVKNIDDVVQDALMNGDIDVEIAKQLKIAQKEGYDTLSFTHPSSYTNGEFRAYVPIDNQSIKTKSQLTDIWKKAREGVVKMQEDDSKHLLEYAFAKKETPELKEMIETLAKTYGFQLPEKFADRKEFIAGIMQAFFEKGM